MDVSQNELGLMILSVTFFMTFMVLIITLHCINDPEIDNISVSILQVIICVTFADEPQ